MEVITETDFNPDGTVKSVRQVSHFLLRAEALRSWGKPFRMCGLPGLPISVPEHLRARAAANEVTELERMRDTFLRLSLALKLRERKLPFAPNPAMLDALRGQHPAPIVISDSLRVGANEALA